MKILKILSLVIIVFSFYTTSKASDSVFAFPEYRLKVSEMRFTAPNQFEFAVYLKHVNPGVTPFYYSGAQYFFNFNNTIANGGTLSYGYVSGVGDSSDLPVNFRPRSPMIFDNGNGTSQLRLAVNTFPGPGNGHLIPPNSANGIKVCKMKLTTTAASFSGGHVGLVWRDTLPNPFTKIFAYTLDNNMINKEITNRAWHSIDSLNVPLTCDYTWIQKLTVSDAGTGRDSLKFGMSQYATNGVDPCLGEVVVPPPPPTGIFDCRFILPNNDAVKTDMRKDSTHNMTWRMTFQPSISGYPVTFSWSPSTLPATGAFFLKDEITGTIVNVNMRLQTSYTLTNSGLTSLKIEYLYNQTLSSSVTSGWNIVSVPLRTQDMLYTTLFPGVASQAYVYSNGYVSISMLSNGTGYWMRFNNPADFSFTGYPWSPENMLVSPGWNLIGPFDEDIPVSSILSNPSGIVNSSYFGYNSGYYNPDTLKVGKGYWIRTTSAGYLYKGITDNQLIAENPFDKFVKLTLHSGDEVNASLYLGKSGEINSDYSLPPVPPQGIFDARFGTDKMVEVLGKNHQIRLTPSSKEIVLSAGNAKGMKFRVRDEVDGTLLNAELTEETPVVIPANLSSILIESMEAIPLTYELSQNYPNPFNPVTVIKYQIPNDGLVKIAVYDVLGKEVKLLVNGFRTAGVYEARLDAGSLASGVYFYRMTAGSFDQIKKMMVLK